MGRQGEEGRHAQPGRRGDGDDIDQEGDGDDALVAAPAMIDLNGKRVMAYPGPTDFRYGINGLSLPVGQREEGVVYAFCGKSGRSLKFLEFEKDAVWLSRVRIRRGSFPFPRSGETRLILAEEHSAIVASTLAVARAEDRRRYANLGSGFSRFADRDALKARRTLRLRSMLRTESSLRSISLYSVATDIGGSSPPFSMRMTSGE